VNPVNAEKEENVEKNGFEPLIVGFLCNWCSYAGADLAGTSRVQVQPNLRIVRVMCSGRVSPDLVLRTFREGADGVMILGCHIGDCHYTDGNHRTKKRVPLLEKLLDYAGIGKERLCLDWVSASEGDKFGTVVDEFINRIRKLGPLPEEVSR